jgi:hypothetical protein
VAEHDAIATMYSPILRRVHGTSYQAITLAAFRAAAAGLRYWKKLFYGCYFSDFHANPSSAVH